MYNPKYHISDQILNYIGEIEASREVINNAPIVPFFEKKFQSDAVIRTVHHGTHIEGNDLSLDQTKKILEGELVIANQRDIQEVINYRNVVALLDELRGVQGSYSPDVLKDIQRACVDKIVPLDKVGEFRTTQVVIKNEATGDVILRPPPFNEVPYLVNDLFEWLNSPQSTNVHSIIKAGIAHYILTAIHPFIEGNGRTARAFTTLLLVKEGYDTKRFFAFEEYFDQDPAAYYQAFSEVDKQSNNIAERDITPWLEYFTKVVAVEYSKIKEKIRKISVDSKIKVKLGHQVALTERQMKLVEYLTDKKTAAMRDLKGILPMVSEDTILRDLKGLIQKDIVRKETSTKQASYRIISPR
jgi:Fic family protein